MIPCGLRLLGAALATARSASALSLSFCEQRCTLERSRPTTPSTPSRVLPVAPSRPCLLPRTPAEAEGGTSPAAELEHPQYCAVPRVGPEVRAALAVGHAQSFVPQRAGLQGLAESVGDRVPAVVLGVREVVRSSGIGEQENQEELRAGAGVRVLKIPPPRVGSVVVADGRRARSSPR